MPEVPDVPEVPGPVEVPVVPEVPDVPVPVPPTVKEVIPLSSTVKTRPCQPLSIIGRFSLL